MPSGRGRDRLTDRFGASLSLGTLVQGVRQAAATLAPMEPQLMAALPRAAVLPSDETGGRRAGTLARAGRMWPARAG